jgi:hypothetical protein
MAGYSVTYSVVDEATAKIEAINKRIQQLRAPLEHQQRALAKFVDVSGLNQIAAGFTRIAKSGIEAFGSLARVVPPLAAITGATSIAGMVKLVSEFGAWGDTLARNAEQVNLTKSSFYDLQRAAEAAGGDTANMTQGLKDLTMAMGNAATGQAPRFVQRLTNAGKSLFDVNHHLRDTGDVLGDVLDDINSSTNAFDRHNKAVDYGGDSLDRLAEDFRRSGKPLAEWRAGLDANQLDLEKAARAGLEYNRAMGELNGSFREVGVELATAFTPLIHEFAIWVRDHKKEIVAGTKDIAEGLKTIGENAKLIAEIFAVAWGVRAVAGVVGLIIQVRTLNALLATTGVVGATAAGMLGRLGIAGAAIAGIMAAIGLGRATGVITGKGGPQWDPAWGPRPKDFEGPKPEEQPPDTIDRALNPVRRFLGLPTKEAPAGAPAPPAPAGAPRASTPLPVTPASLTMPAPAGAPSPAVAPSPAAGAPPAALASLLASGESGGDYNIYNRGSATHGAGHADFSQMTVGELTRRQSLPAHDPNRIFAFGKYQVIPATMREAVKALNLDPSQKITPELQEKIFNDYLISKKRPQIGKYIRGESDDLVAAQLAAAREWASVADPRTGRSVYGGVGGNRASISAAQTAAALQRSRQQYAAGPAVPPVAQGAPLAAPGAAGASGAVDVTITHKNAPPGASVSANGTGGVNVAPPRTVWQDMENL